jgi:hypothetical protein
LTELSLSEDDFHNDLREKSPAKTAIKAAENLGISAGTICIEKPKVVYLKDEGLENHIPLIEGSTMFRGRAVERLIHGLPRRHSEEFTECPHEKLEDPGRVHIDPYGNVHLCQGLLLGNISTKPLSQIVQEYDPYNHPISGPIIKGGPAQLAWDNNIEHTEGYVDECHMCFNIRKLLIEKYPEFLAPLQVYGL